MVIFHILLSDFLFQNKCEPQRKAAMISVNIACTQSSNTPSHQTLFSFQASLSTLYCSYSENNKCFLKDQGYIQRPEFITVMKKGAFLFQQLISLDSPYKQPYH